MVCETSRLCLKGKQGSASRCGCQSRWIMRTSARDVGTMSWKVASMTSTFITFLSAVIKNTWQKQPKEGRISFGSQFEGMGHPRTGIHGDGIPRWQVTLHLQSGSRVELTFSLFWSAGPQLTPGWIFSPQLTQYRKSFTDMPRGLSPKWPYQFNHQH